MEDAYMKRLGKYTGYAIATLACAAVVIVIAGAVGLVGKLIVSWFV